MYQNITYELVLRYHSRHCQLRASSRGGRGGGRGVGIANKDIHLFLSDQSQLLFLQPELSFPPFVKQRAPRPHNDISHSKPRSSLLPLPRGTKLSPEHKKNPFSFPLRSRSAYSYSSSLPFPSHYDGIGVRIVIHPSGRGRSGKVCMFFPS